ncbi:hypothetical protein HD841_002520 [Sphingomonas melonis]|uniref:Uncharacterized protein n=1 Tax=Sphingomonas melonis TaxID=152682 RepID=A0A7Y9K1A9_9SPHN|nr:hypothetical protein [Sphingomonas melonis]
MAHKQGAVYSYRKQDWFYEFFEDVAVVATRSACWRGNGARFPEIPAVLTTGRGAYGMEASALQSTATRIGGTPTPEFHDQTSPAYLTNPDHVSRCRTVVIGYVGHIAGAARPKHRQR